MRLRYVDLHILASGRQENTTEQYEINKSFHTVQNGKKAESQLASLDVLITCTEYEFTISVYHKPTFIGQKQLPITLNQTSKWQPR